MTFDPFGDFEKFGYLRNIGALKDREIIKFQEHLFFVANLEDAFNYLSPEKSQEITYQSFLDVHRILFGGFYPWAGMDRSQLGVARNVGKGDGLVEFELSERSRQAIDWGLNMAADPKQMRKKPGAVMGAFAWGHPFLDGNGRTILLIHTELCARAGFAINWVLSEKMAYLQSLTDELWNPDKGILDNYLSPFIRAVDSRMNWKENILSVQGLDGALSPDRNISYLADDPEGIARYNEMKRVRGQ